MLFTYAMKDLAQDSVCIELRESFEPVPLETFRVRERRLRQFAFNLFLREQRLEPPEGVGKQSLDLSQPIRGRRKGFQATPESPQSPHEASSPGRRCVAYSM